MHWIQTIRENLELSQEELGRYLRLSRDTIKSVETGRRQLPFESMAAAIVLYNVMKDQQARGTIDHLPSAPTSNTKHLLKRLHRQCCRRLKLCTEKLTKMQKACERAYGRLGVYRLLVQALPQANSRDNTARLKWTQDQIKEAMQCIKDNDAALQGLLTAEIAGLETRKQALERILVTDYYDAYHDKHRPREMRDQFENHSKFSNATVSVK